MTLIQIVLLVFLASFAAFAWEKGVNNGGNACPVLAED